MRNLFANTLEINNIHSDTLTHAFIYIYTTTTKHIVRTINATTTILLCRKMCVSVCIKKDIHAEKFTFNYKLKQTDGWTDIFVVESVYNTNINTNKECLHVVNIKMVAVKLFIFTYKNIHTATQMQTFSLGWLP